MPGNYLRCSAVAIVAAWALLINATASAKKKQPPPTHESLEQYIARARASSLAAPPLPGSLWTPDAAWTHLAADVKAHRVGDLLTIILSDQFTATADRSVRAAVWPTCSARTARSRWTARGSRWCSVSSVPR